jgi:hypothetical protein
MNTSDIIQTFLVHVLYLPQRDIMAREGIDLIANMLLFHMLIQFATLNLSSDQCHSFLIQRVPIQCLGPYYREFVAEKGPESSWAKPAPKLGMVDLPIAGAG